MFINGWQQWLGSLARRVRGERRGQPSRLLGLEVLEDRSLLSVLFQPGPYVLPANRPDLLHPSLDNADFGEPIEPFLSINPRDPGNLAVSTQNGLQVSGDAGSSFNPSAPTNFPLPASFDVGQGDTATAYDAQGRLFWANLGTSSPSPRNVLVTRVDPASGTPLGSPAVVPNPTDLMNPGRFGNADKEFLAADANPNSPFANNLYVSFDVYDFTTDEFEVFFSRSTDQGRTWSTPIPLSVNSGPSSEGFTWPSTVSVAPNGDVYVAYHAQPDLTDSNVEASPAQNPSGTTGEVVVFRSTDGGLTFSQRSLAFLPGQADVTFNRQDAPSGNIPGTQFWTVGAAQPWVLADPTRPGTVYVVANDDPDNVHGAGDDGDVVLATSTDFGKTWKHSTIAAGPVNVPGFINNSFQLFPTAAIDPFGDLVVAWYDNRRGLKNASGDYLLDVFATYSSDGGRTWAPDFMVNDPGNPFDPDPGAAIRFDGPPPTTRIGEYFGIDVFGGTAYVAWNGNLRDSGGNPVDQQVDTDAFAINGSLTVNGDDGGVTRNDQIILRGVAGNPGFIEVLVNGSRQYAGLTSALSGGIHINGAGGTDTLILDYANGDPVPAGGVTFDGGLGTNTLTVLNRPNLWDVTGHNSGTVNGNVTFTNVQDLVGGAAPDRFVFFPGGSVDGLVDGGAGSNTLDYSPAAVPVTVNLGTGTATGTGGIARIQALVGGAATTLVGPDTANTWDVTGTNSGTLNNTFRFSSVEDLTGGALADTFVIEDGAGLSGILDGGSGSNTVMTTQDADFTLGNSSLTTTHGTSVGLANIQTADLTGGPGDNTFDVSGWTGSGALSGGGGSDTVVASKDADFNLSDSALSSSDGMVLSLSGIQMADLTGGPGNNTFDVSGWTGSGTLSGDGAKATVVASKDTDFALSDSALSTSDGMSLTLSGIGAATLLGGPGDNVFQVSGWSGVANLDGGAGNDSYLVTLGGLGSGQTNINDSGTTGNDTLLVLGTPANELFTITAGQVAAGGEVVNSSGVENRGVVGGGGSDIFNVLVTADRPFALLVEGGLLNVLDVSGGAQITNTPFNADSGLVTVLYPGVSASLIAYQGVPEVNPGLAQLYVQGLYRAFVQRFATAAEADYWAGVLQSTGDAQAVARDIINLPEARAREVDGWFRLYLGREPRLGEELPWVVLFEEGFSDEQVLGTFLNQPEYYARAGFQDPVLIQMLSEQLRGRPATPDEGVMLEDLLRAQGSRYGVAELLLESPEHRALVVENDFQTLLGRLATQAELQGLVFSGLDFTSIEVFLATTPEFLQHQLST